MEGTLPKTTGYLCEKLTVGPFQTIIGRVGRWIDFENDYKTLYPWFMESVWWVFKQLYEKGLVYRGVKVMPFSTACSTSLSNFESGQNYKEVTDPAGKSLIFHCGKAKNFKN